MRRIIAHFAASADGFIARLDGDVEWLDRPWPKDRYGLPGFYRSVDTLLMGRKTWEIGRKLGGGSYPGKRVILFSRRLRKPPGEGIELARGNVGRFGERIRREKGKDIWLMGGADLIGAFLDAGQVDELVVHVIPTLIGEGIPLVAPRRRDVPLKLLSTKKWPDGVVRLQYRVLPGKGGRRGPA